MPEASPFKWRHYQGEIILLCVRWYVRYSVLFCEFVAGAGITQFVAAPLS